MANVFLGKRYDAVSFDCYGTLIDWDAGASAFFQDWSASRNVPFDGNTGLSKFAQAQYRHQQSRPFKGYRQVLADAFADMAIELGISVDRADLDAFAASVGTWPAFNDTVASLRSLKAHGCHLAVLSNVDTASFEQTHLWLEHQIDTIVTAEMAGAYKPDLRMFETLLSALNGQGISPQQILHVAQSRFHDVAPANEIGLDVVWIDRRHGQPGSGITIASPAEPMARFNNLADCVDTFTA